MTNARAERHGNATTTQDIADIRGISEPLLGLPAWNPSIGHGSFLTAEFGAPHEIRPGKGEPYLRGEWHLWVYCSMWRLETPTAVVAASEDSHEVMSAAAGALDGKAIGAVDVVLPSLETTFRFRGGPALRVFPIYSGQGADDPESWMLFTPGNMVLVIGPGASWRYERSDK